MVHDIKYLWKRFRIHLPTLHAWIGSNVPEYIGASAEQLLILHFSKEPNEETMRIIKEKWDSLTEEEESAKIEHEEKKKKILDQSNFIPASK